MTLEEARNHIGDRVTNILFVNCFGTITSVNDNCVFVRYDNDITHPKATRPSNLRLW